MLKYIMDKFKDDSFSLSDLEPLDIEKEVEEQEYELKQFIRNYNYDKSI